MSRSGPQRSDRERAGHTAELAAAIWLRLRGFRILARRYATPVGEVDLIARRGGLTVFVEVKRRAAYGDALEAILPRQQRRIAQAAALWLRRHPSPSCRFDAIAVSPWRLPVHVTDIWRP